MVQRIRLRTIPVWMNRFQRTTTATKITSFSYLEIFGILFSSIVGFFFFLLLIICKRTYSTIYTLWLEHDIQVGKITITQNVSCCLYNKYRSALEAFQCGKWPTERFSYYVHIHSKRNGNHTHTHTAHTKRIGNWLACVCSYTQGSVLLL